MATYPSPTLDNLTVNGTAGIATANVSAGTIDGTTVGITTPAAAKVTTLETTGAATLASVSTSSATITGGAIDGATLGATTPATASVTSLNGGALAGRRNIIINGNFQINQRVVSGTVSLAAGIYGHDRWKGGASGATYTFATSGTNTTLTISAGSVQQVIEGVNVSASTYTLSWTGTAQGRFNGGTYASSPVAITGITPGANLTIEFNTGTLGLVQVENGVTATPFEHHLITDEQLLCQRYYQKSFPVATAPAQNAGSFVAESTAQAIVSGPGSLLFPIIRFIPRMAASPTVTLYNPSAANAQARNLSNGTDCSATSANGKNESGISILCTTSGTTVAGHIIAVHWAAEAEL